MKVLIEAEDKTVVADFYPIMEVSSVEEVKEKMGKEETLKFPRIVDINPLDAINDVWERAQWKYTDDDLMPVCFHRKQTENCWQQVKPLMDFGYTCREPACNNTVPSSGKNCFEILGLENPGYTYYLERTETDTFEGKPAGIEISPGKGVAIENDSFSIYLTLEELYKLANEIKLNKYAYGVKNTKLECCTCGCNDQREK